MINECIVINEQFETIIFYDFPSDFGEKKFKKIASEYFRDKNIEKYDCYLEPKLNDSSVYVHRNEDEYREIVLHGDVNYSLNYLDYLKIKDLDVLTKALNTYRQLVKNSCEGIQLMYGKEVEENKYFLQFVVDDVEPLRVNDVNLEIMSNITNFTEVIDMGNKLSFILDEELVCFEDSVETLNVSSIMNEIDEKKDALLELCNDYGYDYEIMSNGYIKLSGNNAYEYYIDVDSAIISFLPLLEHSDTNTEDGLFKEQLEYVKTLKKNYNYIDRDDTDNVLKKPLDTLKDIKVGDYISVNLEDKDSPILSRIVSLGRNRYILVSDDESSIVGKEYHSLEEIEDFIEKSDSFVYCIKDRLQWEVGGKYLIYDNTGDSDFDAVIRYFDEDKTFKLMFGETDAYFYEDEPFYSIEDLSCRVLKDFSLVKQLR